MKHIGRVFARSALWAVLIGIVVAGGMAYYTYVYEQNRYTASAGVYIKAEPDESGQILPVDSLLKDTRAFLRDPELIKDAEAKIRPITFSGDRLKISVEGESGARIITLMVTGEDARACQRAVNALGEVYCDYIVDIGAARSASVTMKAQLSDAPTAPNRPMKIALTFVISFGAALIILLLFTSKTRYMSSYDTLPVYDLPVIGSIADFRKDLSLYFSKRRPPRATLYAVTNKAAIEDVRRLALNLSYAARGSAMKSIVLCSSEPDEGKSTLSVLLGSELAMQDKSVLLIDMDSYSPSLGKLLGQRCRGDLIDLFSGEMGIEQVLMETPIHGLYYIGNRHTGASATRLIASSAFSAFINHAYEQFDYVLFDTPPINLYMDALALGNMMDATVLVAGDRQTKRDTLRDSIFRLRSVGAKLRGVAFTFVKHKKEKLYRDYEDSYEPIGQND